MTQPEAARAARRGGASLQRRLLVALLVCAPLVWAAALVVSVRSARHEVDELFDTELVRLARQVEVAAAQAAGQGDGALPPRSPAADEGDADVRDLAIAVWDRDGHVLLADREGVALPRRTDLQGFVDLTLEGQAWRVYYQPSAPGGLIAAGQKIYERDELVIGLTASQVVPWLLVLPVLLLVMAWAVRRALAPLHRLTGALQARGAGDLRPIGEADAPADLQPLLAAIDGLLARIGSMLERERRFTADAAHELRTPLAALAAQWDVLRRSEDGAGRARAEAELSAGLQRLNRLVAQLLALSRVESATPVPGQAPLPWPELVGEALGDCLPLADRRGIEVVCTWPPTGRAPLAMDGDAALMTVLLRNLLDNAIRYAPRGSTVTASFTEDGFAVENDGEPLAPEEIARLGERFHRRGDGEESGSGLGISIARRVAELHGLRLEHASGAGGRGLRASVRREAARPGPA